MDQRPPLCVLAPVRASLSRREGASIPAPHSETEAYLLDFVGVEAEQLPQLMDSKPFPNLREKSLDTDIRPCVHFLLEEVGLPRYSARLRTRYVGMSLPPLYPWKWHSSRARAGECVNAGMLARTCMRTRAVRVAVSYTRKLCVCMELRANYAYAWIHACIHAWTHVPSVLLCPIRKEMTGFVG